MSDFTHFLLSQFDAAKDSAESARHLPPVVNLPPQERYIGRELIGEGGQKRIYKCLDLVTGRDIALALPLAQADEVSLARFRREGRIASLLEHPHILPVYDLGCLPEEGPFFTMRLASRRSMGEALAGGRISFAAAVEALISVCLALECAHSHGISHFDVKPDNIQLGQHGEVLLCDWGLAGISYQCCSDKIFADEELRRIDLACFAEAMVEGTPGFAAPEIWKAGAQRGPWSDIFSLGRLLEAVLTAFAIEAPGLSAVAAKASSEEIARRYASVAEFRFELERFRGGFATGAEAAGPRRLLWLLVRRQPVATAAVSLLLLSAPLVIHDMHGRQVAAEKLAASLQSERLAKQELQGHELPWLIQEANRQLRERHFDECAALLPLMRSIDPHHPKIKLIDACLRISRGDWDGAASLLPPPLAEKIPGLRDGSFDGLLAFLEALNVQQEPESCLYRNLVNERFSANLDLEQRRRLALAEWRLRLKGGNPPDFKLNKVKGGLNIDLSGNPGFADFVPLSRFTAGRRLARLDLSGCEVSSWPSLESSTVEHLLLDRALKLDLSGLTGVQVRSLSLRDLGDCELAWKPVKGIQELDLRGSRPHNWSGLAGLKNLRRLVIDAGVLPQELRPLLPAGLAIEER